jgi:hypothetical protein
MFGVEAGLWFAAGSSSAFRGWAVKLRWSNVRFSAVWRRGQPDV